MRESVFMHPHRKAGCPARLQVKGGDSANLLTRENQSIRPLAAVGVEVEA
jgi:hypothetical protein